VLIDLHCHTRVHSSCSSLEPERLVELARARGLDAVCLTEHDRLWDPETLRELSRRLDFPILRGVEVTTETGHVLALGLEELGPDLFLVQRLRERVIAAGGLMAIAHPARSGHPTIESRLAGTLFDLIETLNGSDGAAQNGAAGSLARKLRLPGIGGSDCHAPHEVGTAATRLAREVTTEAELIAELRRGLHVAVDLRESRPARSESP
jgi:predicted metal-dependent phosphoesterase TrpH